MRVLIITCLSLLLTAGAALRSAHAAGVDLSSPESVVAVPALAMTTGDLVGLFSALSPADQAKAKAEWANRSKTVLPTQKADFDDFLAKMLAPDAVESLAAEADPQLKAMNPQEAAGMVQMFGGMMAMQMAQDPKTQAMGQNLQQLATDLAAWLPTSGINDPAKLRTALGAIVSATQALGVTSADELFALSLEEVLTRGGKALLEGKKAFAVYGLDVNAFFASMKLTDVAGEGDRRTANLHVTAFAHQYTMPVKLVQKNGQWTFDTEELQQTVGGMVGGMMGGGAGPGAGEM